MAKSAVESVRIVEVILLQPSSPTSSIPAVSIMTTGPYGKSSTDFLTGSVVVPGTSLTIESCCPIRALTSDDLPTFRRPTIAICSCSDFDILFN